MKLPIPQLANDYATRLAPVPDAARGFALAELAKRTGKAFLHISANDRAMHEAAEAIAVFAPEVEVLLFPAWDCLPYDRISPRGDLVAERLSTLARLATSANPKTGRVVLTTIGAAIQRVPPHGDVKKAWIILKKGQELNREALFSFLAAHGYHRAGKVLEAGEYAVRGSIIDLFPAGHEDALRIDMFGDEVESLRRMDPLTQLSGEEIGELSLKPASEIALDAAAIERFRAAYRDRFGAVTKEDPLYEAVSAGQTYAGMEHWLPLFYERLDTIFDYCPESILVLDHQIDELRAERLEQVADYYQARRETRGLKDAVPYHPLAPEELYLIGSAWEKAVGTRSLLQLSPFTSGAEEETQWPLKPAPQFPRGVEALDRLREFAAASDAATILATQSRGSAERIAGLLAEHGMKASHCDSWPAACKLKAGELGLLVLPLETGFLAQGSLNLLSEQDVLGERVVRTRKRKRTSEAFLMEAAGFAEGELLVHKEHGIARYAGLTTLEVNNTKHDCLTLVYDGDDRLFLPVENMDLVSRYGADEEGTVKLDKLGSVSWQKRKSGLKKRLRMMAEQLLRIAAERSTKTAPEVVPPPGLASEFAARFPYTETDDQLRAIEEVLEDLASGRPMDRLICGDVGFGKTEVAMRAAFAAMNAEPKMQVAIIAPTTLLARQHYATFRERFRGFKANIGMLSRLVTPKRAKEVKEGLADGSVDIVIGTHALLAKDIQFQRLGLLIVDEEQHFGVKQKEQLKELKSDIHVLTLSATPIPRTLQMSLTGIRELSLITTPPVDRLAVRTHVIPYDPVVLREAIQREKNRGGQTFYVTPRIKYMADLKSKIETLVPEAKIATAHGQMTPVELDRIMGEFYDGKYDVLLSTAIIESGIDIPTANTMIIDRAGLFGLSQLYQLRGRVGRSKQRAYAYFTMPHAKTATAGALKRLEVMQSLDSLGAGFSVASHDMDMRGFGNLLGEEQSGQVKEVGIELYQHMLEEAVHDAKNRRNLPDAADSDSDWSPQINMGISVLIPEDYIEDLDLRLSLYRRLSALNEEAEIESFAAELIDRFGKLPEEVEHLLDVLRIKQWAKRAGVERVDLGPKGAVFSFRNNVFAKPEPLLAFITQRPTLLKLRADNKVVLKDESPMSKAKIQRVEKTVQAIAALAA